MKPITMLCIALLPASVAAFQPLITDDTATQGTGSNQLEAAYNRTSKKFAGSRALTHEVPLFFTRGVNDTLDLYAGTTQQRIAPDAPGGVEHGWSNPVWGAKWRFYEGEKSGLSFALKPEIRLAVTNGAEARGLGTGRASYSLGLLMTQETGFGSFLANLVLDRTNYSDDVLNAAERRTVFRLSVAPVWDIQEGWKVALDAGVMTNPDRTAQQLMGFVELGAIFSPSKDLDLAVGLIRNVSDGDVRTLQATVGMTWRFR